MRWLFVGMFVLLIAIAGASKKSTPSRTPTRTPHGRPPVIIETQRDRYPGLPKHVYPRERPSCRPR